MIFGGNAGRVWRLLVLMTAGSVTVACAGAGGLRALTPMSAAGSQACGPDALIVGIEPSALSDTQLEERLAQLGYGLLGRLRSIDAIVLRVPPGSPPPASLAAQIEHRHRLVGYQIRYAEPNRRWHTLTAPNDPLYAKAQGILPHIGSEQAWERTANKPGEVVAVLDAGIDLAHPDLQNQLWQNPGEVQGNGVDDEGNGVADDMHGAGFLRGTAGTDLTDGWGHGTPVAGIVAAQTNNGEGIAAVAWHARLMVVRMFDDDGVACTDDAVRAIDYAVRSGARIINVSWGSTDDSKAMREAISRAESADALVVAAAGNSSRDSETYPVYPASFPHPNIISVHSTMWNDSLSNDSNFGHKSVDLGAPGSVYTTIVGDYDGVSGTSMAAPHVSGALVLVRALASGWNAAQLKDWLLESALPVAGLKGYSVTGARLDLERATSAPVALSEPDASGVWDAGKTARISWQPRFASAVCASGDLELSLDDGQTFTETLAQDVLWTQSSATVAVPSRATTTARVRARCSSTELVATSDRFTIRDSRR